MSLIGPRPLLVQYLPRYNEEQHHRHDVRPGLTGYAQAHGRNAVSWEEKFAMDVPLSVLEAMAARLPIIGTDVGGMNDLISNNGYLIEDNKESLLSAMSQMLYNSKIEMEQMGLNSRKKVLSYTSSQMADRYMEIYDSL